MVVTWGLLVLPHSGAIQVISIGLQNTSMISFQVLPFTWLDCHLTVVTELQEEINRGIAAAHNWRLTPYHPVFPSRIWPKTGVSRRLIVCGYRFLENAGCWKPYCLVFRCMHQIKKPTHLGGCRLHCGTPSERHHKRIGSSPGSQWPSCSRWSHVLPSTQWGAC